MDVVKTVAQVLLALLAVVGFYGFLHGVLETFLRPRQLTAAVMVDTAIDAAELDILLCEAKRSPSRRRGQRMALVISADLMSGPMGQGDRLKEEYALLVEKYGAEVCVRLPRPDTRTNCMDDYVYECMHDHDHDFE